MIISNINNQQQENDPENQWNTTCNLTQTDKQCQANPKWGRDEKKLNQTGQKTHLKLACSNFLPPCSPSPVRSRSRSPPFLQISHIFLFPVCVFFPKPLLAPLFFHPSAGMASQLPTCSCTSMPREGIKPPTGGPLPLLEIQWKVKKKQLSGPHHQRGSTQS